MVQPPDEVDQGDDRDYQAAMARARRAAVAVREAQADLATDLAALRAELEKARRAHLPAHQP